MTKEENNNNDDDMTNAWRAICAFEKNLLGPNSVTLAHIVTNYAQMRVLELLLEKLPDDAQTNTDRQAHFEACRDDLKRTLNKEKQND